MGLLSCVGTGGVGKTVAVDSIIVEKLLLASCAALSALFSVVD